MVKCGFGCVVVVKWGCGEVWLWRCDCGGLWLSKVCLEKVVVVGEVCL